MRFGDHALGFLESGGDFFLGFCVLCGAAFAFMRSPRASLFVALAGLALCVGVVLEYLFIWGSSPLLRGPALHLFFTVVGVGRHVVFFGGLTLALRTIARSAPA